MSIFTILCISSLWIIYHWLQVCTLKQHLSSPPTCWVFFFFNMRLMYELIYALVIYNSSHPIQVPKNLRKQIVNQKITRWAWIQSEKLLNGFSRFTTSREDSSELYTVLCAGHCFLSQEFLETWRDMCICSSFYEQCLFMTLLHFLLVVHLSCVGKASFVFVYNFFPICLLLSYLQ